MVRVEGELVMVGVESIRIISEDANPGQAARGFWAARDTLKRLLGAATPSVSAIGYGFTDPKPALCEPSCNAPGMHHGPCVS